jgi:hypothetical protein
MSSTRQCSQLNVQALHSFGMSVTNYPVTTQRNGILNNTAVKNTKFMALHGIELLFLGCQVSILVSIVAKLYRTMST